MLGERLAKLRLSRNLTQQQLADKLKISRATYAQYEIDRREPDNETLSRLATFFEVSIDYLVTGKHPGPQDVSPEEAEFLEWAKQVDSVFFYDFHKSPDEQKQQFMETLRALWEVEKKRGNIKPKE